MVRFSRVFIASGAGALLLVGAAAHANPNTPRRARQMTADLVRAYADCTPTAVNTMIANTAACAPIQPLSAYSFATNGVGNVQVRRKYNGLLQFSVVLRGVLTPNDLPVDKESFRLQYVFRITTDLCADGAKGGSCTATIAKQYPPIPCVRGNCVVSFNQASESGEILTPLVATNIEIQQIQILDPDGQVFAVPGINTGLLC
jgi:hypothetical protein